MRWWLVAAVGCGGATAGSHPPTSETGSPAESGPSAPRACDLPLDECLAAGCETLDAAPHTIANGCATADGPAEPVACWAVGRACGDVETWARPADAASDLCWRFPTTCQPEGWVACEPATPDTCP